MPDPTLEETLLRKASSIGQWTPPPVTESRMPVMSPGLYGWLNPAKNISLDGVGREWGRQSIIETLGKLYKSRGRIVDGLNHAADYVLGYDPEAVPVGNPHPSVPMKR